MSKAPIKIKSSEIKISEIKISDIDLSHIDLADERYQISDAQTNVAFLAQSILEIGLVNPVVLLPVPDNLNPVKYIIISGFNRVKASLLNKATTITARLVHSNTTEIDGLSMAISCASFKRPLSTVELIKSLIGLSEVMDVGEIVQRSAALFNCLLNEKYIEQLISIGRLQAPSLELLEAGFLSIKTAKNLSVRNPSDTSNFLMLFSKIKASTSIQLEMILYLTEISKRDKVSIESVLKNDEIQNIIDDENKDLISKTQQIRECVSKMRFPALFQAHQNVKQQISSLGLGRSVKIEPPPNFEAQQFKFSFSAKTHKQFIQHFNKLASVVQATELKDIFNA